MTAPIPENLDSALARAREYADAARNDDAREAYLEILRHDPENFAALNGLGSLTHAGGFRSAARTIYEQVIRCHPQHPIGHINLGTILYEEGAFPAARLQFETALTLDADNAPAHRGLAQTLSAQGEDELADRHWRRSFPGQAIVAQRYRGTSPGVPLLLLVSARGGNIPTHCLLDDHVFAVTALYVEFYKADLPLPPHAILFNAIGDADLCSDALSLAEEILARTTAPIINPPAHVRQTGRARIAARLATLPGVRTPHIQILSRARLAETGAISVPLLLRSPGFHTGQHFVKVETRDDLRAAAAALPGESLLAIEHLDARDGQRSFRKYRVMVIDGALYPIHLAISTDWKVHYFTADMAANPAHRREEARFLVDMEAVIGAPAIAALAGIGAALGLDYAGIDFALDPNGAVLVFEANATMVINPPPSEAIWDYRRTPISQALKAFQQSLLARVQEQKD